MSEMDFDSLQFAENPDQRCAVALVLDCSDSMTEVRHGETRTPLDALNGGLDTLIHELHKDPLAKRRVEVSVISYGTHVSEPTPFATVSDIVLPTLVSSGVTATGGAIVRGLDALEERKATYKANGVPYLRPWIMVITDGLATDDTSVAAQRVKDAEDRGAASVFMVGVDGADMDALRKISVREPLMLKGLKFDELFVWLSASQTRLSASMPGDKVQIPTPAGWAEMEA